jgi:mannose-6-phosphate isomerase-like protein (cupin superfamily)
LKIHYLQPKIAFWVKYMLKIIEVEFCKKSREKNNKQQILVKGKTLEVIFSTIEVGEASVFFQNTLIDRFLRFEIGEGIVIIGNDEFYVEDGTGIFIPQNQPFQIKNIGCKPLKYSSINGRTNIKLAYSSINQGQFLHS